MTRTARFLVGGGFVLHGLAHALPGMRALDQLAGWPVAAPEAGSAPLLVVGTVLWGAAMVGLVGAGFGVWGVRPLARVWRRLGVAAAGASILLLGLLLPEYALSGVLLSTGALLLLWRWRTEPALPGPASSPKRPGPVRRIVDAVALLFLVYLTITIVARPWHMRWGSTAEELALALPGDEFVEEPVRYGIQHAVTIHAPAEEVWPWLVQMGQDRAGFYSYDWLERLFGARIHNVGRIVPEWQALAPGDSVFATQPGYLGLVERRLGWRVARVDSGRALVLEDWGAFVLEPAGPEVTRLIVRTRGGGRGSPVGLVFAPAGLLLFEVPHFIMERRMLLGIRELAEGTARVPLADMDRDAFLRHLDRRVPEWMEREEVPGAAILLVQEGAPIWSKSFGWADRDARRPLDTGSIMMTHSISKSVTAWGVMRLVEEGRIGLDDPVGRYLPDWAPAGEGDLVDRITVRHLLSHTSGLPLGPVGVHYEPGQTIPPLEATLTGPGYRPIREPGVGFEYSNLGYGVLEWLVQEVTGRDFGEFMRTEVLLPLGMGDSTFDWNDALHADVPTGYDLRGAPVPPYVYPFQASGGLLSTLEDLGRFVAAGMMGGPVEGAPNPVLQTGSVAEMYRPQIRISGLFTAVAGDYGLGHFLETLPGDRRAVWHGGQGLGWMTHFHAVPETRDGIVILTNSQRSWPLFAFILRDWAEWRGVAPVGMGRLAAAQGAMKGIVVLILLAALGWALRLGQGLAAGRRRPGWFARTGERSRALELAVGLGLAAGLLWAVRQDYLYITSVFPSTAVWLGWSLAALGGVLLASAFFPTTEAAGRAQGVAP